MRKLLIALLMAMASAAGFAAEVLVMMRSGVDDSLLEERKVETAVEMRTVSARSVAGKIFVGWTSSSEQAFVSRDRHGRALEVARQVIYGETTLTANYLEETVDSDGDGVPDGWELYWYGDLDETATSDTDGDGYTFAEELAAGTDPLMPDRGVLGGVVWADSCVLQYNPEGLPRYRVRSEPEGELFETYEEFVLPGTRVQTVAQTGGTFAYWTTNGVRVADRHGRARDSVTFMMGTEPVDIVAVCESDEMRRQQLYWYGTTIDPASDTDGDGYSFAEEMAAGTDPLMPDRAVLGGIVWADSAVEMVNLQIYEQMQGALVDGEYEELFFSPYAKNAATSRTFAGGAQIWPVVTDVNGDGLWDLIVVSATTTNVFVNVGTKGNPQFANCGSGLAVLVDLQMNSTAKLAEMELDVEPVRALSATTNGATLLVSDGEGRIWYYTRGAEDVANYQLPTTNYQLLHKVWGGTFGGFAQGLMLAAVDWEDDGDLDCLCGTAEGKLMLLRDPKVGRPTNLKAASGVDNVLLSWDPNRQSRVRGYKIYRDDAHVARSGLPTWRDTGLAPGDYGYEVSAVSRFYVAGNSTPTVVETPRTAAVTATVGTVTFAWNDAKAKLGEPAAVMLSIANSLNYDVAGKEQTVAFDPAYLTFVRVEKSGLTDDLALETSCHEGVVTVRVKSGKLAAGSGTFLTFVFETVKAGKTAVGGANVEISDDPVVPFLMGDLDGDGDVDKDDLMHLARFMQSHVNKCEQWLLQAGDLNGNGKLDNADFQALKKLLKNLGKEAK